MKPSKPRCYADSSTQEGKDIVLKCKSSEGSSPLKYSWEKTSDSKLLPASSLMGKPAFPRSAGQTSKHSVGSLNITVFTFSAADPVSGTVTVKNASDSASGTYRCTASNRVGTEDCVLQLKVTPRT